MRTHIKEMKDKIVPVLKRHDVARAAIFGSFVRGEMKKDGDIDNSSGVFRQKKPS